MPNTPDTTPSADARELYPDQTDASEYGGRWQLPSSRAVDNIVDVTPVTETLQAEQLDLFGAEQQVAPPEAPSSDKYGHVEGASARVLRTADQAYLREQYRRNARGRGPGS